MGDEEAAGQPTREDLERQLREARNREFEANVTANRLYTTASQAEAEQAFAELKARQDEVARLQDELAKPDKPPEPPEPEEDILSELDAESEHAALEAGMGGGEGQTPEQAHEEAGQRNRRTMLALAASGSVLALAILIWLALQQQPAPVATATPTATVSTTASPVPTPTGSPRPSSTVSSSPTAGPGLIGTVAVLDFTREGGVCALAETFTALFHFEAVDSALTLTQLPEEHVTTGTLTQASAGGALFSTTGEGTNAGQTYDGTITGTTVAGTHVYTAGGCDDTYTFAGRLYTPFLAPPPWGTTPAGFDFIDAQGLTRQLPTGEPARISVLGLLDGYVVQDMLPLHVVMTVGDEMPWDFIIDGQPPGGCVDPLECYADSPTLAETAWFAPGQQPVLVAYDATGAVAAVYAPNGIPRDFEMLVP